LPWHSVWWALFAGGIDRADPIFPDEAGHLRSVDHGGQAFLMAGLYFAVRGIDALTRDEKTPTVRSGARNDRRAKEHHRAIDELPTTPPTVRFHRRRLFPRQIRTAASAGPG